MRRKVKIPDWKRKGVLCRKRLSGSKRKTISTEEFLDAFRVREVSCVRASMECSAEDGGETYFEARQDVRKAGFILLHGVLTNDDLTLFPLMPSRYCFVPGGDRGEVLLEIGIGQTFLNQRDAIWLMDVIKKLSGFFKSPLSVVNGNFDDFFAHKRVVSSGTPIVYSLKALDYLILKRVKELSRDGRVRYEANIDSSDEASALKRLKGKALRTYPVIVANNAPFDSAFYALKTFVERLIFSNESVDVRKMRIMLLNAFPKFFLTKRRLAEKKIIQVYKYYEQSGFSPDWDKEKAQYASDYESHSSLSLYKEMESYFYRKRKIFLRRKRNRKNKSQAATAREQRKRNSSSAFSRFLKLLVFHSISGKNLSNRKFAEAVGVSEKTIRNWKKRLVEKKGKDLTVSSLLPNWKRFKNINDNELVVSLLKGFSLPFTVDGYRQFIMRFGKLKIGAFCINRKTSYC